MSFIGLWILVELGPTTHGGRGHWSRRLSALASGRVTTDRITTADTALVRLFLAALEGLTLVDPCEYPTVTAGPEGLPDCLGVVEPLEEPSSDKSVHYVS